MNKAVFSILMITLASLTGGCSYISEFIEARKKIEEQEVKPISVQANTTKDDEEEVFADLEESEELESVVEVAGLIPATDPDVRARLVERGRNDPFSVISIPSKIEYESVSEDNVATTQDNRRDRQPDQTEQLVRRNSEPPTLPELPPVDPTLARNVQILGLYKAPNGVAKLIVQAPEESSSRYVEVGQYLSNGQVLVKSIDYSRSAEPQIILEQSGIEVFKSIGEEPYETNRDLSYLPPVYKSLQG